MGKINILMVDDDTALLDQAKLFLEKEDSRFEVETVESAEEGFIKLSDGEYHAVIADYKMPEVDGLEFLNRLKNSGNELPFIMLTGKGREDVAIKALNLGADRYIRKSGSPKSQYGVLAEAIKKEVENKFGRGSIETWFVKLLTLLRHDTKNKLQIITGYLQIMEEGDIDEKQGELIKKTLKACSQTQEMIEKIGLFKDIIIRDEIETIKLSIPIQDAVELCALSAEKRNIAIEKDIQNLDVEGFAFLEELFANLIENAVQHSQGSIIHVSAKEEDGYVVVSVEDDGVGIQDEVENLFQCGYKGTGSTGSGLGLFIVKTIADLCGGRVELRGSALGGARFDVILNKPS